MKTIAIAAALGLAVIGAPTAQAGCLTGAAVGGVAGHAVGHGVLGAAAGCVVGRHRANARARDRQARTNQYNSGYDNASRYQ